MAGWRGMAYEAATDTYEVVLTADPERREEHERDADWQGDDVVADEGDDHAQGLLAAASQDAAERRLSKRYV